MKNLKWFDVYYLSLSISNEVYFPCVNKVTKVCKNTSDVVRLSLIQFIKYVSL